ncbi:lipid-binding SYLF domain-containing protein [Crenobacter luteus]|uniref:Ysc84 actin-binding domain-containing protein n=1 Tax=Crenobacter luteus TaxID=1452487 RepID=A0A161SG55_9NEIS|nr:YSC84-related protein [Crenobacter luteus]KZE32460.1 hypothetical protein AVW16_11715 [Crenobacter luteus]TCP10254.1 lipid-binding SYLF domain-containing protein [Crenobacter luteus]
MKMKPCTMIAALLAALVAAGCTTTSNTATPAAASGAAMSKRQTIDAGVDEALARLYREARGSRELIAKSKGVLVFPSVLAAGLVVGGEYGEGALREGGRTSGYYRTASGSFGLQAGAQSKAIVLVFMTQEALDRFRNSSGWTAGVDANVALIKVGADGSIDTKTAQADVAGFVMTNAGLMVNVSLQGTKISRLDL